MTNTDWFPFSVAGMEWILLRNVMTLQVTLCTDRHLYDVMKMNSLLLLKCHVDELFMGPKIMKNKFFIRKSNVTYI